MDRKSLKKLSARNVLILKNLAKNEKEADALIISGSVYCGTKPIDKPGEIIIYKNFELVYVKKKEHDFVSRGGVKLSHAISYFNLDIRDKICMDLGASTGGFTQVLLENGAKKVYAVDVGYNELDYRLQIDKRVINLNRVNAKFLNEEIIPEKIDIITCDVSFISLKNAAETSLKFLNKQGLIIFLIKPQFEAARNEIQGGIVKDLQIHQRIIREINDWLVNQEMDIYGITQSPIKGAKGNIEYFISARSKK